MRGQLPSSPLLTRVTLTYWPLSCSMNSAHCSQQLCWGSTGTSLTNNSPEWLLSASALANWAEQQLKAVPFPHPTGVHLHPLAPAEREGGLWETPGMKMMTCYRQADFRCRAWNETVSEVWGAWPSDDDALHYVLVNNPSNAPSLGLIKPEAFLQREVGFSTPPAAGQRLYSGLGLPKANA